MKTLLIALAAFCSPLFIDAQVQKDSPKESVTFGDIAGLWTGTMQNDSTGEVQQYEVYISKEKGKYTGYSHTWFDIDGEKYYGVKKLKINIAKDGKIVLLDAELKENNYPFKNKNIKQLNVLDRSGSEADASLSGLFVTNCTKSYYELTGKVSLKRKSSFTESSLMRYLEKGSRAGDVTVVKEP